MSPKIFGIDLVAICKSKLTSKLNKPAYVGMCILHLSRILMYNSIMVTRKYANKSRLLFTDTDSFLYEIKTKDVYEGFNKDKEMFNFNNHSAKSKYYDDSKKLVVGKTKNKTGGAAIEEFVGLKPKMYSFSLDDSSDHKKVKGVNKHVFATTGYSECKDFLLNNKCFRHSMKTIQSKNHKTGAYKIYKISSS